MATSFGVNLRPPVDKVGELTAKLDYDPYGNADVGELIETWIPLASLINNLNRAVGQHDAYPFVLTPEVIAKLGFIARLVHDAGSVQWTVPSPSGPLPINVPAGLPELPRT